MQQAVAQLAMAPISAWRSCFQEFRDIAPNSGLKGNAMHTLSLTETFSDEKRFWESDWWSVIGDQLEAAASAEASAYARFGVTSRRDRRRRRTRRRVAELVFWAMVGGLRSQKYQGGKSASAARQSGCDVGAV